MWIIGIILILLAIYLFLIAPRIIGKPDRSALYGVHYAHRGLFDNESQAPENSLAAIRKAVEEGYGIEFDVQLSKDDIPVVFHDASLKRMCGVDGKVWEYTLEELQQMKLGKSNETIPTFEQVLNVINAVDSPYFIPGLTMGDVMSSFEGVYDTVTETINEFNRTEYSGRSWKNI